MKSDGAMRQRLIHARLSERTSRTGAQYVFSALRCGHSDICVTCYGESERGQPVMVGQTMDGCARGLDPQRVSPAHCPTGLRLNFVLAALRLRPLSVWNAPAPAERSASGTLVTAGNIQCTGWSWPKGR